MASDAAAAFEQDMQDVSVGIMDAAAMMPDMVPSFPPGLPVLFPPPLLTTDPAYLVKAEQTDDLSLQMQLLPDHPSLGFMNVQIESSPMESVEESASLETMVANYRAGVEAANAAAAASFSLPPQLDTPMAIEVPPSALSTPSPPLPGLAVAQPLAATLQTPSPPFSVVSSSLEAALIPTVPLTSPPRSTASQAHIHLPSIPTPYASSSSQSPTSTTLASQHPLIHLPPAEAEQIVIKDEIPIAKQKKEVASLLNAHAVLATESEELSDEIKSRIAALSRMAAQLSISSNETSPPPPAIPPTPPASVPVAADLHGASDQSRKRGPCELDEHRSVKAMKREPQDQVLPIGAESLPLDAPSAFPATSAIPSSALPSISRPASPHASFAAAVAQYALVPPQLLPPAPPIPPSSIPIPPLRLNTPLPTINPTLPLAAPSVYTNGRAAWGDGNVTQTRHHHSLSAGAILNPMQVPTVPVASSGIVNVSGPPTPITTNPPLVRTNRSGSVSSLQYDSQGYFFNEKEPTEVPISGTRSARGSISLGTGWYFGGDNNSSPTNTSEEPCTTRNSPSDDDDDDSSSESDDDENMAARSSTHLPLSEGSSSSSAGADVPAEYRAEVDRVFFEYLNKICSNWDQIHQTLMAKKMQRLDESPDFRPFKFRILAFTTAFLEELARQGYTEDKIPMKKIRNYLWRQPHILRFNEDGKKAKSKGNHIWNVEARKLGDGKWEFRPFHRKLSGTPPSVAYVGLRWTWAPRVWDPQNAFEKVPVQYSSPNLPPWLSWKGDILSGVPTPDAEPCQVTVVAQFVLEGVEGQVSRTFTIAISPVGGHDGQFPRSRRPSGSGEAPRRSASDSALSMIPQRAKGARVAPPPVVPIPGETSSSRVIRVLQNVAQRVTDEAEHQIVDPSTIPKTDSLQDIVMQKHVLDQTVEAMDMELSGHGHSASKRLVIAAQQVVIQAAANVIADRNVSIGRAPVVPNKSTAVQRVSVSELSDATHDAIAAAVKTNGPRSTEVDIIVTAASILKAKAPAADAVVTPAVPPRTIPSMNFASNLSTLPELP
ncbi:hypothetical protein DFP72DRAFT_873762 [Ephemerocybe angulata]|uniref:Uncharacterized protein n=1 Tax=Ephemerocybe angulata TaxID=980116 RepID=A0A8H6MGM2_9AGAR|nr:hypothetical protein DFP72DRAFT_873762 [Tulosesus angulatus]